MRVEHDSKPSGHTRVDDQIGGYSEDTAGGNVDEQRAGETAAYPGDTTDFADEHMRPTFSDELAESPAMQPDEDTPGGLKGMD
jgi:hypothetical protein